MIRLYGELSEMTDAGREMFDSFLKGTEPMVNELIEKGFDLRDARQIAMDAVSMSFADVIRKQAVRNPDALNKRAAEISNKQEGK